jgi:hypothetical protein
MKKLLPILCTFILLADLSYAQRHHYPIPEGQFPRAPGFLISTGLFSLFEPEGGPSAGFEYRLGLHWAVALDAMAILYKMPELYPDDGEHKGFRFQPQIKYYFAGKHRSFRGYFSLMGTYKDVHYSTMTSEGEIYNGTSYDYYPPVAYTEHRKIIAGSFNIGFQKFLGDDGRIFIEPYAGFGFRYRTYTGKPEIDGDFVDDYYGDGIFDGERYLPHISYGFKLGYRF